MPPQPPKGTPRKHFRPAAQPSVSDREHRIFECMAECKKLELHGEKINWSHMERHYKIDRKVLRGRFSGKHLPRAKAHEKQQTLSAAEETALVDWACLRGLAGHPWSADATEKQCFKMTGKRPGKKWFLRFWRRHEDRLRCCHAYGLDPKRAANFTRPIVEAHFRDLLAVCEKYGIPIENIYNMDEKGLQIGGGRNNDRRKYLFARFDKRRYILRSDNLELITIIETTCADGTDPIPTAFIAKPGDLGDWFMPEFPNSEQIGFVATSENGWMNDLLCEEWFEKVFVPRATARNASEKPILLIFDGHGSHLTPAMIDYAFKHNVILFLLPSKTSHMLQPLDVGIFNHVQRLWEDRTRTRAIELDPMEKVDVIREYLDIRRAAFVPQYIDDAWRRSGIKPHNPGIFTDDHYAPAQNFSTIVHVPEAVQQFRVVPSSPSAIFTSDPPDDMDWEPASGNEEGMQISDESDNDEPLVVPRTPSPI